MINIFNKIKSKRQKLHSDFQKQVTDSFNRVTELRSDKNKFALELKRRTVKSFNGLPVVAWSDIILSDDAIPVEVPTARYLREHNCICISDRAMVDFDPTVMETLLTHQYYVSTLNDRSMSWDEIIYEADRLTMYAGKPLAKLLLNSMVDIKKVELKYSVEYGFSGFLLKRINRLMHV